MSYKVFRLNDTVCFGKDICIKAKIISIEVGIFNDNMYVIESCANGHTQCISEAFMQEFAEVIKE